MVDETNELSNSMSNSLLRFELFAPVSLGLERDVKSGNLAQDPTGLTNWLAHPKQMLAQRDPVVMQLYGEWNEILMPNLHLSEIEISARIEHMNAETYKVTQGESA
ncbi:MAG: hypothetical protein ABGY96_27810 [bacterium]|nr:hypothetical protein [Gammaproteobacteria bacterium]HIL98429.1 hypothetical protein [Pseudomonadales bacterium]